MAGQLGSLAVGRGSNSEAAEVAGEQLAAAVQGGTAQQPPGSQRTPGASPSKSSWAGKGRSLLGLGAWDALSASSTQKCMVVGQRK